MSSIGTPSSKTRNQRPRVTLMIPERNYPSYRDSGSQHMQHSPYIMTAATSGPSQGLGHPGGQPNWPNPFVQQLYAQKAGDFVCKQFEGLNRFTKSGLSVGEKSAVWLYAKFRVWSRKWFTHCFLFIVVLLYSIFGALAFMAIEGPAETQALEDMWEARVNLAQLARELSSDEEKLQNKFSWEGDFRQALRAYEAVLYTAFEKGQYDMREQPDELENAKKKWSFFNSMFFCGTIYTTIGTREIVAGKFAGPSILRRPAMFMTYLSGGEKRGKVKLPRPMAN